MRTGVPLHTLREEVLIEAGFSTDSGHAAFSRQRLNQLLARHERMMAREDDWPGIDFEEQVTVAADARYVNLPTYINYTDISQVHVSYGTEWLPVNYGITARERSIYSATQRATPVSRWEVVAPGNVEFEVWPIGSTAQTLLFTGSKTLGGFSSDEDTCTLDADVLVLRVAAEILGRDRKEDASYKMEMAGRLTENILKRQNTTRAPVSMGGTRQAPQLREGIDYIAPGRG